MGGWFPEVGKYVNTDDAVGDMAEDPGGGAGNEDEAEGGTGKFAPPGAFAPGPEAVTDAGDGIGATAEVDDVAGSSDEGW